MAICESSNDKVRCCGCIHLTEVGVMLGHEWDFLRETAIDWMHGDVGS